MVSTLLAPSVTLWSQRGGRWVPPGCYDVLRSVKPMTGHGIVTIGGNRFTMIKDVDPFEERRLDLGLTWAAFADLCGLSRNGLWRIRRKEYLGRALTHRRIEDALGWVHGDLGRWQRTGQRPRQRKSDPASA